MMGESFPYLNRHVILPRESRLRIVRALEACEGKRQRIPDKKHGNIPL